MNSIEAVKKKIKVLQDQAEEAEERAERLQREVEKEKRTREEVRHTHPNDVLKSGDDITYFTAVSCQVA